MLHAGAPSTARTRRWPVPRKVRVTLVKSIIGLSPKQEATVKALGLHRIRHTVEQEDTPTLRGMIKAVEFCLKVDEA
ncbi:MAG: 50S ribosomal protein L30 [Candidatus Rokubacteria bacterium]|nr:50S ribosomal protein L30 [Candidatus Rokubacteria bacterium]